MSIHDLIFAAGSAVFAVSLVPAVLQRSRIPRSTSVPTALVLTAFLVNYTTMDYSYSAATTATTCLCWWVLVVRR